MSKNILKEAIADAKELKRAALKNAENLMLEGLKTNLKEMVDEQMNEEDAMTETSSYDEDMTKENAMEDEDVLELDVAEEGGDDEEVEEDEADEDMDLEEAGFSESDLHEALVQALTEVDHGDLGEMDDMLDPDRHEHGLMDEDSKEDGWQNKSAPSAKNWQIKEGTYKNRIAKLVSENLSLKKTNMVLHKSVNETKLFNAKLFYANKLINKEGISLSAKKKIVERLDTAKSVQEVRNIFESLEIAIGVMSESKKPSPKGKGATLSEALGVSGKTSGKGVPDKTSSEMISEADERYSSDRFRVLAGLPTKKAQ